MFAVTDDVPTEERSNVNNLLQVLHCLTLIHQEHTNLARLRTLHRPECPKLLDIAKRLPLLHRRPHLHHRALSNLLPLQVAPTPHHAHLWCLHWYLRDRVHICLDIRVGIVLDGWRGSRRSRHHRNGRRRGRDRRGSQTLGAAADLHLESVKFQLNLRNVRLLAKNVQQGFHLLRRQTLAILVDVVLLLLLFLLFLRLQRAHVGDIDIRSAAHEAILSTRRTTTRSRPRRTEQTPVHCTRNHPE
mmetsp:Transcript_12760/g.36510  ORF Transcript_12760/g.36510 Transcript_12760/m.36510 type:complete len:244 (-) Transcript_12760:83-814(-)